MKTTIETGRKKYVLHANLPKEDKLRSLKRANAILLAGYSIEKAQRRVGYNIDDLRKWALELNFPLIVTKKSKYKTTLLNDLDHHHAAPALQAASAQRPRQLGYQIQADESAPKGSPPQNGGRA